MKQVEIVWKKNGATLEGRDNPLYQEEGQSDADLLEEVLLALGLDHDVEDFEVLEM